MKTKRIIAGVFAAIVAAALCAYTWAEWYAQGVQIKSLLIGCGFYCACIFGLWCVVDGWIKDAGR